jgi:hypothetical protein
MVRIECCVILILIDIAINSLLWIARLFCMKLRQKQLLVAVAAIDTAISCSY